MALLKGPLSGMFTDFFNSEKTGGLILLACTVISIFIANSVVAPEYLAFWHKHLDLSFAGLNLDLSIEHWINDGLMVIFFLLVGLEIEREIYIGELSNIRNAILPVAAAIGGMAVPALVHFLFNNGLPTQDGMGIPMATDIAFALGMLSLLGNRVPLGLKIFLTALAIIDDLGAILVIAIFYTSEISGMYLGLALGIFAMLLVLNRLKVRHLAFYILPGIAMWFCMLQSGVHSTITGVLLAFAIPFSERDDRTNPSYKIQHFLHKPVAFLILPLFALANTALILGEGWFTGLATSNSIGIMSGLFFGKMIGIFMLSFLMVKLRVGNLPTGVNWGQMLGLSCLAGIGFTMSIFISNLAFSDAAIIQESKIAVLAGSLISCLVGLLILRLTLQEQSPVIKRI
ncbi:MAG: Na+/H+ antiporter NhaA [Chitinophagaceae bacterium]|nr:MAG: Na+/H+ antiporter NhaA [Chitinophagaceae bacterium]